MRLLCEDGYGMLAEDGFALLWADAVTVARASRGADSIGGV